MWKCVLHRSGAEIPIKEKGWKVLEDLFKNAYKEWVVKGLLQGNIEGE